MRRHFPLPRHRIGNRIGATVTIVPWQDQFIVQVRPRLSQKVYALPLAAVAQMVCDRVARNEAGYELARKRSRG